MLKKIIFFSLYLLPIFAMENRNFRMSRKTYSTIQTINNDRLFLTPHFEKFFQGMGNQNNPHVKPSDLLKHLELCQHLHKDVDSRLKHLTTCQYLTIIGEHHDQLDAAFANTYGMNQNVKQTWNWFGHYFKQNGLGDPLNAYKLELIGEEPQDDLT